MHVYLQLQTITEDSKVLAPLNQQLASKCPNAYSVMSLYYPPWITACKAPLSMGFSKQEYWSGLPFPPPGDLPDPGIKAMSPTLADIFFTAELPGKPAHPNRVGQK